MVILTQLKDAGFPGMSKSTDFECIDQEVESINQKSISPYKSSTYVCFGEKTVLPTTPHIQHMLPLVDYERITRTIKAILDSEGGCDGTLLPVFCPYGVSHSICSLPDRRQTNFRRRVCSTGEASRDILTYGKLDGDDTDSDSDHYHAWIDAGSS
jgi:hypothetical protein